MDQDQLNKGIELLKGWRHRANITCDEVDKLLGHPPGAMADWEIIGLYKVPLAEVYKLLILYKVPYMEAYEHLFEPFLAGLQD